MYAIAAFLLKMSIFLFFLSNVSVYGTASAATGYKYELSIPAYWWSVTPNPLYSPRKPHLLSASLRAIATSPLQGPAQHSDPSHAHRLRLSQTAKQTAKKAEQMHKGTNSDSLYRPKAPSPEPGQPTLETSPLARTGLQRSNAVRRSGSDNANRRCENLSNASSGSQTPTRRSGRPFSFAPRMDDRITVNVGSNHHNSIGNGNSITEENSNNDEWARSPIHRLPSILSSHVKSHMRADDIGHYLDKLLYGRDKYLGNIITNFVNGNLPYVMIAEQVLKTLDLRDDQGLPFHMIMKPGNMVRRPNKPQNLQVNPEQRLPEAPPTSPPRFYKQQEANVVNYESPNSSVSDHISMRRPNAALERDAIQRFLADTADTDSYNNHDNKGKYYHAPGIDTAADPDSDADQDDYDTNSGVYGCLDNVPQYAATVQFFKPSAPARVHTQVDGSGGKNSERAQDYGAQMMRARQIAHTPTVASAHAAAAAAAGGNASHSKVRYPID